MRFMRHGGRKIAHEKVVGFFDVADRDRYVIETREAVGRRRQLGAVEVRDLPKLDQGSEGGARRDERGGGAIGKVCSSTMRTPSCFIASVSGFR